MPRDVSERSHAITEWEPSLTKQSFADECNIPNMVAKYMKNGQMPRLNPKTPLFLDVSGIGDYQASLDTVRSAEAMFMALPAKIRGQFDNDPQKLLDFMETATPDQLREKGLTKTAPVAPSVGGVDAVKDPQKQAALVPEKTETSAGN